MGYTRNTGQLSYLITYDGSGNITVPASFTQTTVTSSMLKADSSGKLVAAVAGTDFVAPAGLSAYVPTTRTITINGTSYDLSADRSWSIVSGVSSFNTRTGAITLTDTDVTGALGYTPVTNARTLTINGTTYDLSANRSWTIVAGLSSFNTRTGDITLLDTDVTGALGYTPVTNARTITINGTTYDLSANRTWVVDASSVTTRVIQKFTATASQTTFTVTGGYTVGMVDVFLNGVKLDNATEFTASNGSTVVLSSAAVVNDVVEVYKYGGQFIANNTLRQTTAFTATAGQTTFTVNYSVGFVDVFYNGAKLAAAEFTATNGTSIVLGTACVVNDIVEVVAYNYTVGAFTGVGGSGTTNYIPKWTASGTLGNSVLYETSGSIGINISTPQRTLHIHNTTGAASVAQFTNTDSGSGAEDGLLIGITGSEEGAIILKENKPLWFATNDTERMRIDSAGNVGIGTSSFSGTKLAIQGDWVSGQATIKSYPISSISSGGAAGYGIFENDGTTRQAYFAVNSSRAEVWTTANKPLSLGTNDIERLVISSTGLVGIGTGTPTVSQSGQGMQIGDGTNNTGIRFNAGSGGWGYSEYYQGSTAKFIAGYRDGNGTFNIKSGNSLAATNGISISSNGQVLTPNQPAFYAYGVTGTTYGSGSYWIFPSTTFNRGSHYNTSNGIFTAPIAGVYEFSFSNLGGTGNTVYRYFLYINNSVTQQGPPLQLRMDKSGDTAGQKYGTSFSKTVIVNLAANDTVRIFYFADSGESSYPNGNETTNEYCTFSGKLLG